MKRLTGFVFLAALCLGQTGRTSGVDRAGMDLTCKPCQDFWRYANGTYVDQHPIPARYSRWGTFLILRDANAERMKTVLDSAASNPNARGNERIARTAQNESPRQPTQNSLDPALAIQEVLSGAQAVW